MILVTGGTGFLGSHLVRKLVAHGQQVRALYRNAQSIPADLKESVEWVPCDILDTIGLDEAMQNISVVYHTAAIVSFEARHQSQMYDVNVRGTANVVNAALATGVKKLVHVSSIAALGRMEGSQVITEKTVWQETDNNSKYAITKFKAELEVRRGIEEGLPSIIVNPSVIIGEGNWTQGTGRFFSMVRNGFRFYPIGVNGFVSVHDVVECMIRFMNSPIQNERFILNGENISYRTFFTLITNTYQVPQPQYRLSPIPVKGLRYLSDMIHLILRTSPFLTRETANTVNHIYKYSNEKATNTLNFQFEKADVFVIRTANKFIEYLRSHS